MAREKIGHGVFLWMSPERRTNRYGSFFLSDTTFDETKVATPLLTFDPFSHGGRARVTAVVVANRESGHVGDLALGIKPSTPNVGEEIDLGIANVSTENDSNFPGVRVIVMTPDDGRAELWVDPRQLYRLHDQTVDIYVERTSEPCSPAPNLRAANVGTFANGDGSFQCKKTDVPTRIPPNVTSLGDGGVVSNFSGPPFQQGDWITTAYAFSARFAPEGQLVWQATATPVLMSWGWAIDGKNGVAAAHFRKASREDISAEIDRVSAAIRENTVRRTDLLGALAETRETK